MELRPPDLGFGTVLGDQAGLDLVQVMLGRGIKPSLQPSQLREP